MTDVHPGAEPFLPSRRTLRGLGPAARSCTGCDLHHLGTRTVFGEGPAPAPLMLLGEQPGDREDREGHPFVGPAGPLLDEALDEAGIGRGTVYVTNAVKHSGGRSGGSGGSIANPGWVSSPPAGRGSTPSSPS